MDAQVMMIDFEGRADGYSMRNIITHLAPRNLILVHGSRDATQHLASSCQKELQSLRTKVEVPGCTNS
jgi:cleavage and polyadenylation specificity factor subunit 2